MALEKNLTRERRGAIIQGVLQLLKARQEPLMAGEAIAMLEKVVPPTAIEREEYPNHPGVRRYPKVIRFVTIKAVKAEWMLKTKEGWIITQAGISALERNKDSLSLAREADSLYSKWKEKPGAADEPENGNEDVEEPASRAIALEEIEENVWNEVQAFVGVMRWQDFQEAVKGLFIGMGYHVSWIAPDGKDGGVDIIAFKDRFGTEGPRIKGQVKRTETRIDLDGVKAFAGNLSDSDVGIFVAMNGFTRDAERWARESENNRLHLVNLEGFYDLWTEHYAKIPQEYQWLLPVKKIWVLDPSQK